MPLNITDGATVSKPNGVDFLDEYAGHIKTLYETGSRPLTSIGGTGDVVTATMVVDLTDAGLVDGLCVSLTWAAANTGSVTLAINGGSPIPVVDAAGDALTPDTLTADLTSVLRYTAGEWRIISSLGVAGGGSGPSFETITASVTWDRPTGYADDTMVRIQLWGGGGGGGKAARVAGAGAGGGGGGGYAERWMRIADIPTSVLVTIGGGGAGGATGANGSPGGTSTFGSLMTAYGGGGGVGATVNAVGAGGGGGGEFAVGANGVTTTPGAGGEIGGGAGGGVNASTPFGGGGGGNGVVTAGVKDGGNAIYGGAGGGGGRDNLGPGAAGISIHGGNGGIGGIEPSSGASGVAPGGGGGGQGIYLTTTNTGSPGSGARGECRITIFG